MEITTIYRTKDMIARFIAEYRENIFFRGFVSLVIDLYDCERQQLLKPNDVVLVEGKLTVVSGAFLSSDMMDRQNFMQLMMKFAENIKY